MRQSEKRGAKRHSTYPGAPSSHDSLLRKEVAPTNAGAF
jgi:hypothetical protein